MKLELLNSHKLKITFKADELEENDISIHSFLSVPLESQKLFHSILEIANSDLNFNLSNSKISYELFSFDNQLFIILVTKEHMHSCQNPSFKFVGEDLQNNNCISPLIFTFSNFKNLSYFAKIFNSFSKKFNISSSLYKYQSNYILSINSLKNTKKLIKLVSDIQTPLSISKLAQTRLLEFSNILIKDNALDII